MDDLSATTLGVVPGGQGVPLVKVGGEPEPVGPLRWPPCRSCGTPMRFPVPAAACPGKVDLSPYAAVYVFQCENPDTACSRATPEDGAQRGGAGAWPGEPKVEGERPQGLPYTAWSLGFAAAEEDTAALSVDVNEATSEQLEEWTRLGGRAGEQGGRSGGVGER